MICKTVQIEFASIYNAADHIKDIRDAAKSASSNLLARHHVKLGTPFVNGYQVLMEVLIPEEIVEDFSIGNHLRGISAFLLKYREGYEAALVGRRLLNYTEIRVPIFIDTYNLSDRMSLMAELAEMLKNDDEKTSEKIRKIMEVIRS